MRYLASCLVTERASDDRFLRPLLSRALEELCLQEFEEVVEVSDVQLLRSRSGPHSVPEVITLVEEQRDSFLIVFVHRDQGANRARVQHEWVDPLCDQWGDRSEQLVMVVPVRETEAWMLADGDALRAALRVVWPDSELGVPPVARRVEEIEDPKQHLKRLEGRVSRAIAAYYDRLAEEASVDRLREVPAFAQWWRDTRAALVGVGFRRSQVSGGEGAK